MSDGGFLIAIVCIFNASVAAETTEKSESFIRDSGAVFQTQMLTFVDDSAAFMVLSAR
jgi:hypothetical protein